LAEEHDRARRPARFDLDALALELTDADAGVARRAVDRIGARLARLDEPALQRAVEMLTRLFHADVVDRPDLKNVRERAVEVLAAGGRRVVPRLLRRMPGSDITSHPWLARALGRMGAEALPPLRALLASAEDPSSRAFAIHAIGMMGTPGVVRALPEMIGSLVHSDREVRDSAARTLGRIAATVPARRLTPRRRRGMFEALLRAAGDLQPGVRARAMHSLGTMAARGLLTRQERRALEAAARSALGEGESYTWDQAYIVRREARETLDRLRRA
jgi:HEAT repeat protein